MIRIQALETNSSKERRPLQDIDVNQGLNHANIPSKDGRNAGKASIFSGLQVFADGETASFTKKAKVPVKSSADDTRQLIGDKKPFQIINGTCSKSSITKDTAAVHVEQVAVGSRGNSGVYNGNSLANRTVSTTSSMNELKTQLASMHVANMSNKAQDQVLVTDSHYVAGIEKAVPKEINVSEQKTNRYGDNICARSENLSHEQVQKSAASNTGAVRKVVPTAACSTEVQNGSELPTFTLNAMAKEWNTMPSNTTKRMPHDDGTWRDSTQFSSGVQQLPSFWDIQAHTAQPNLPNPYTDATNTYLPTTATQPIGRKIVGRKLTPFERGHKSTDEEILRNLDDRTMEIERFLSYKEAARQKALQAMRLQQGRIKWRAQQYQNIPTNMKNQLQPVVTNHTNYPTERSGVNGFQHTKNTTCYQTPTLPLPASSPGVKPSVCIIKYPTPPNVPIRYEPTDLLKMNHTPNKHTDKWAKKSQAKSKK